MRKRTLLLLLFLWLPVQGQEWRQFQLDTFFVNEKAEICIEAQDHFGVAFRETTLENHPTQFRIDGNIFYSGNPEETEAFFVFGSDTGDTLMLWTAGYSLAQKHIILGKINIGKNGNIRITLLARKPVEIIDHRNQNVYRIIFIHQTNEIKIEVNGVPMLVECPTDTRSLHYFGYMIKGQLTRFESLRFHGE